MSQHYISRYIYANMWARKSVATLFIHNIPQWNSLNVSEQ